MADTAAPELDLLKKDVGEWDADLTITPGPGAPSQPSRGRLSAKLIAGGKWLVTEFKNHTTGFEGHGIYGYNGAIKRYVGTWVDDTRSNIYVAIGDWDAAAKTMTYQWTAPMPNGHTMAWMEITQVVSPTEQVFRSVFPLPDGGEFEMMRVTYRKVA